LELPQLDIVIDTITGKKWEVGMSSHPVAGIAVYNTIRKTQNQAK